MDFKACGLIPWPWYIIDKQTLINKILIAYCDAKIHNKSITSEWI